MIGNFVAITPQQLAALQADPSQVVGFLYPEDEDEESELPNHLDVDKAWHAIHFLLNGKTWDGEMPWFLAVLGGAEIGEDVGYGPARFLTPQEVKTVAAALSTISAAELAKRYDPKAMDEAEIYPEIWMRDGAEGLEYVQAYFREMVEFYRTAAERGDAALLFIN
jgi:hypothetical protein